MNLVTRQDVHGALERQAWATTHRDRAVTVWSLVLFLIKLRRQDAPI